MSHPARHLSRLWIVVPLIALAFLLWAAATRAGRVELVTSLGSAAATVDPTSPTGYAHGLRMLIVPGHNNESYQAIVQTQTMIATGEWRLRHVDYDNAPMGRTLFSPSPYRWWLATVAWFEHLFSKQSLGLAVERAALWVDPALQGLFLLSAAGFAWWRFGWLSSVVLALGIALLFPLAAGFVPGAPDSRNLTHVVSFASVLALIAGMRGVGSDGARARPWFIAAGVLGGIALWLSVSAVPILIGIALGALGATWLSRRKPETAALPWRAWAWTGAGATLGAFLVEYAPAHLDLKALRLTEVHPLYALAWLGGGELLVRGGAWLRGRRPSRRDRVILVGALVAVLGVPAALVFGPDRGFLTQEAFARHLTLLNGGIEAENVVQWLSRDGITTAFVAAALPLVLIGVAVWLLIRKPTEPDRRTGLIVMLGAVVVSLGFACWQLSWWNQLDYLLLGLLVAATATDRNAPAGHIRSLCWIGGTSLGLLAGLTLLVPKRTNAAEPSVSRIELEGLIERDFAHWLARRAGPEGAIVLAPPSMTASLFYHGGLRGLGSPYRENGEGFRASVRIAGATSADEAQALARQRKLTHIVIPSWDSFLDEYARLGANQPEHSLVGLLHQWLPPRWLRPISFQLPRVAGLENEYLIVFEVTDVQDNGTALSRLAEYFVEMERTKLAARVGETLADAFPSDLGALVARARLEIVRRDEIRLKSFVEQIKTQLEQGTDEGLPWDRRVSLCLVLAQGGEIDLARNQIERTLEEMGEPELRSLPTLPLYRFITLCNALEIDLGDPELKALARNLLPPEIRDDIQGGKPGAF